MWHRTCSAELMLPNIHFEHNSSRCATLVFTCSGNRVSLFQYSGKKLQHGSINPCQTYPGSILVQRWPFQGEAEKGEGCLYLLCMIRHLFKSCVTLVYYTTLHLKVFPFISASTVIKSQEPLTSLNISSWHMTKQFSASFILHLCLHNRKASLSLPSNFIMSLTNGSCRNCGINVFMKSLIVNSIMFRVLEM